ncbi:MAG TPA: aminodeoxychorismate lyase [Propionibacteriaceae bacterium]|nr:aminodeoxychorismate lyase [Propionibacteriaceae bacterium]
MTQQVQQVVAVLGRGVVDPGEPVVSADDLGFTRGDGVFDATRVVIDGTGRRIDNLDAHLARFARSIHLLEGEVPDLDQWRALIGQAVAACPFSGELTLKIMWTRGRESVVTQPFGVLTLTPMTAAAIAQRAGVRVAGLSRGMPADAFADAPWLLGGAKTLSYVVNVGAKREAARRGADDVLFLSSDGYCLEGPTSSLVAAFGRRLVTTPRGATGILGSITQEIAFDAARAAGFETADELLRPEQLFEADGVWLLSSVRGAAPILELDRRPLPQSPELTAQIVGWTGF